MVACACAVLTGCGGRPVSDGGDGVPRPLGTIEPAGWIGDNGLELRRWTINPAKHAPGPELFTYEPRPVAASPEVLAAWRRAGLRVLSVPTVELDALRGNLKAIGATETEWLGEQPRWSPLAQGPIAASRLDYVGPDGGDFLNNERPRLLIRCWAQTAEDDAGQPITVLRAEIAAQMARESSAWNLAASAWGGAEGRVHETMTLRTRMREGDALVIIAERPDVSWAAQSAVPPGEVPPEARTEPLGPSTNPDGPQDPFVTPTLGELLLTQGNPGSAAGTRTVLALVPRTRTPGTVPRGASGSYRPNAAQSPSR